jgi:hypothetical protein
LRKVIFTFLIYLSAIPNSYSGWVGSIDERQYVKDWNEYPYNITLQKRSSSGICTAQYFENKYIITAAHCVTDGEIISKFIGSKGEFEAILVKKGDYARESGKMSNDWAVYRVDDPKFYAPNAPFVMLAETTQNNKTVQLSGFSHLRVLTNDELFAIRDVVNEMVDERKFKDLKYSGPNNAQNASTLELDSASDFVKELDNRLASRNPAIDPLFGDYNRLKVVKNCSTFGTITVGKADRFITHNCDSSQGASGGALIIKNGPGYDIVGLVAQTYITLGTDSVLDSAFATRPETYYKEINVSAPKTDDPQPNLWSGFDIPKAPAPQDKPNGDSWSDFSIPKAPAPQDKPTGDSWSDFNIPRARPVQQAKIEPTDKAPSRISSLPTMQRSRR